MTDLPPHYFSSPGAHLGNGNLHLDFMRNAADGIVIVDADTLAVVDTNATFAAMLGYGMAEVRRMSIGDWDAQWTTEELKTGIAEKKLTNCHFETRHRCRDGSISDVWVSTTTIEWQGRTLVFCVVRDTSDLMQREQKLQRELDIWQILMTQSNLGLVILDKSNLAATNVNLCFAQMLGYQPEELIGLHPWDWDARYSREEILFPDRSNAGIHGERMLETRMRRKDGTLIDVEVVSILFTMAETPLVFCICRDITARCAANKALLAREQEFRSLAENAPDAIVRYDRRYRRLYVNPAFEKMVGKSKAALLMKSITTDDKINLAAYKSALETVFCSGMQQQAEISVTLHDGTNSWLQARFEPEFDEAGSVDSVLVIIRDITDMVTQRELAQHLAYTDPLTELPNRTLFEKRFCEAATQARETGTRFALMMLDIDQFKDVNDSLGHSSGDALLHQVARRLADCMRESDTVARMGGDEFAMLQPRIHSTAEAQTIAERILAVLSRPFIIDGHELFISASVGLAFFPDDSADLNELFTFADTAMYSAKRKGRSNIQHYTRKLTQHATERLSLGMALRHAVEKDELRLYYQPKIRLADGRTVGLEALLRWQHPTMGLLTPDRFIGIAEETGLIVEIGAWVLKTACQTAIHFNHNRSAPLKMAVNLSCRQFVGQDLATSVEEILRTSGCPGEWLEFEITESLMIEDNPRIRKTLETIRAAGITIAIDDFGTGYSALNYLSRFPIDVLKIDRSFVHGLNNDQSKAGLVKVFMSLGQILGKQIVAEGVETAAEANTLLQLGCNYGQGYLYGKPMPFDDFLTHLAQNAQTSEVPQGLPVSPAI